MWKKKDRRIIILRAPLQKKHQHTSAKENKSKVDFETGSKYRAHGSWEGGEFFSSKKELKRWRELQLLQNSGHIRDLKRQVRHKLVVNGVLIATYVSDAEYVWTATGRKEVEDTKSPMTKKLAPYRMKKALMKALFGIVILET